MLLYYNTDNGFNGLFVIFDIQYIVALFVMGQGQIRNSEFSCG